GRRSTRRSSSCSRKGGFTSKATHQSCALRARRTSTSDRFCRRRRGPRREDEKTRRREEGKKRMPRTRSLAWSELKIGLMAIAALALTAMLFVACGGASGFAWERYELKTTFDNVQGLKSGALVRIAGVEVGKVTKVELSGAGVAVELSIKKENKARITTDSRASIGAMSLLGEALIDITPAATGTPLNEGDTIKSVKPPLQLNEVAATANAGIEEATALLKDIRGGKGTVGKLFTD